MKYYVIEIHPSDCITPSPPPVRVSAYFKILLLIYPLYNIYPPIKEAFLNSEIEKLNRLKGKLIRGANLSQRERKFIKALCSGLYDKWLKAI
ncbi:hypothetical protein FOFC_19564 [Fusarium oxysporum]|nr:hypothetical protein FOFC_19564 [Fusarium oxysporum]